MSCPFTLKIEDAEQAKKMLVLPYGDLGRRDRGFTTQYGSAACKIGLIHLEEVPKQTNE